MPFIRHHDWGSVAETDLAADNRRLRESNRRLGELARVLAHDMGAPMRAITSFATLIAKRVEADHPELSRFVEPMGRASKRIDCMIRELYEYALMEPGTVEEPADANIVMREVTQMLHHAEYDARVSWQELPEVSVGYPELRSVLLNLVDNAIRHHDSDEPTEVEVRADREGDFWRFTVADNGNGIAEEQREWALRPFGRLDRQSTRAGMGLPMARRIAQQHSGDLWLEDTGTGGCAVCFTLPASNE